MTITAKITDPDGVGPVTLSYQTVDPGAYIRTTDAGLRHELDRPADGR